MIALPGPHGAADEYADLEIGLHRRDAVTWTVELRFSLPRTDAETQLDVSGPLLADIDARELDAIDDEEQYGLALGSGIHNCVGQMIARLEAECLLSAFVRRVAAVELAGAPKRRPMNTLRTFETLPLRIVLA